LAELLGNGPLRQWVRMRRIAVAEYAIDQHFRRHLELYANAIPAGGAGKEQIS
jgi:hypothetical protein